MMSNLSLAVFNGTALPAGVGASQQRHLRQSGRALRLPAARGGDFHWPPVGTSAGHKRGPHRAASGDFLMATDSAVASSPGALRESSTKRPPPGWTPGLLSNRDVRGADDGNLPAAQGREQHPL